MNGLPPRTLWHLEQINPALAQASGVLRVIHEGDTPYQHVQVIETAPFGVTLVLDGKTQSSEADEWAYHEALVQPVMTAHPNPRRVMVAGGGEGATIREALRHPSVEEVVMVDLDADVVNLCKAHLPNHHQGAFDDPRVTLLHEDALAYLEGREAPFDVIVIDVPDPLEGGPAYLLYTVEFYQLVRARLAPGGLMVAQSGPTGPTNAREVFTAIARTMGQAFDQTSMSQVNVPSFGLMWGFIACGGADAPDVAAMPEAEVDERLRERGVAESLRFYDGAAHRGMFGMPKYVRAAVAAETRLITRDNPLYAV